MAKRLESSAERRLQVFRRELILDLYTRHGKFWCDVRWVRELRGIEAEARMPPPLDLAKVHLPPGLKSSNWSWSPEQQQEHREWMVLLHALHDAAVPPDHRVETPNASSLEFWMGFLSACVLFDPPAPDLLAFADHGVAAYGEFVNPLNPWADEDGSPQMLAPPIRFLPNADELLETQERLHYRLIDELHRQLAPRGIDLWEMVYHVEYWNPSDVDATGSADEDAGLVERVKDRPRPYIIVDPSTTEEDVRNAFRLMAAALHERPRPIRPRRDRLVGLQCAIWYDECRWSHERIAKHFGWTVQYPAHAKPRSETARQYIAEGRELLTQRKAAA